MRRTGGELSFEEAIAAEPERLHGVQEKLAEESSERPGTASTTTTGIARYVGRSMYAEQLERWLALFPREQLLALRVEDFAEPPGGGLHSSRSISSVRSLASDALQATEHRPATRLSTERWAPSSRSASPSPTGGSPPARP